MNALAEPTRFAAPLRNSQGPASLPPLTPAQAAALEKLEVAMSVSPVVGFTGARGAGLTTIVQALAAKYSGRVIGLSDVVAAVSSRPATSFEESFDSLVVSAFGYVDLVIIDDYLSVMGASNRSLLRPGVIPRMVARHLCSVATENAKRIIFVSRPMHAWDAAADIFGDQAALVSMPAFTVADYEAIARHELGAQRASGIDLGLLYRYAGFLNLYQLGVVFALLAASGRPSLTTPDVIRCLEDFVLTANTVTAEVEALSFDSLPGAEAIVEELETHVVLPLENRELAQKMRLKAKRGVLLYGPPGTGKTSIGRALAHRMKGKFFLIDGSFVSEPPGNFFQKIQKVVQEAKDHSPSVLFIDDADVLFRIDHIAGLVRYLLSLLDGLESESASGVCVMMTAMNVKLIPDALLRSGRIELWLETKAPGAAVRAQILQRWMGKELPEYSKIDYAKLAALTEGFTPADLRRIAGDAKSLYAADIVAEREAVQAEVYLHRAVEELVAIREAMAETLGDPSLRVGRQATVKYPGATDGLECGW